jgi:hypothetical protein
MLIICAHPLRFTFLQPCIIMDENMHLLKCIEKIQRRTPHSRVAQSISVGNKAASPDHDLIVLKLELTNFLLGAVRERMVPVSLSLFAGCSPGEFSKRLSLCRCGLCWRIGGRKWVYMASKGVCVCVCV